VLFHVTADPRWSDLPISGAFVDMLNAIVDTAGIVAQQQPAGEADTAEPAAAPWKPLEVLDGFGDLGPPDPGATLVSSIEEVTPSAATPPGIYDRDGVAFALNTLSTGAPLVPLVPAELGWQGRSAALEEQPSQPIWPWLLAAAAVFAILDGLAVLALMGRFSRRRLAPARGLQLLHRQSLRPDPAVGAETPTWKSAGGDNGHPCSPMSSRPTRILTRRAARTGRPVSDLSGPHPLWSRASRRGGRGSRRTGLYALIYWPIDVDQPSRRPQPWPRSMPF
jgi:hypothetical protein